MHEQHWVPAWRVLPVFQPDDPGVEPAPHPSRLDAIEVFGICLAIVGAAALAIWMVANLAGAA